jgi:hypothetical protein
MPISLYGERIALRELADDEIILPGTLAMPDIAGSKQHYFLRVVNKGDGKFRGIASEPRVLPDVNVGDVVMVQINPSLAAPHRVDGNIFLVQHWGDAIAKIIDTSKPLGADNIQAVGRWVIASRKYAKKEGEIFLPDSSVIGEVTNSLHSSGATSEVGVPQGTRLYLDQTRANPFNLGDTIEVPDPENPVVLHPQLVWLVYLDTSYVLAEYVSSSLST